jgi:hypothetical protein
MLGSQAGRQRTPEILALQCLDLVSFPAFPYSAIRSDVENDGSLFVAAAMDGLAFYDGRDT